MNTIGFVKCFFSRHCIIDKSESIVNGIMHDERNFLCKCQRCGLYVMHDGAMSGLTSRFMSERKAFCIKREIESSLAQLRNRSKTTTNADVIRAMSDDELDDFLASFELSDIHYEITFCDLCMKDKEVGGQGNVLGLDCDGCRKHWLQSDATETNGLKYWENRRAEQ